VRLATFVLPLAAGASAALAGCARPAPAPVPTPPMERVEVPRPNLPQPPAVDGPLQLSVVYPPAGARVAVRDSNFIFGATGSGQASLTINGAPVTVAPNGAFLAYLPVPPDGVYRLQAAKGTETAAMEQRVDVPAPTGPAPSGARITSITPAGALAVEAGEGVEVSVRGSPGARVQLVLPDGARVPLVESGALAEIEPADDFRAAPPAGSARPSTVLYHTVVPATMPWVARDTSVAQPRLGAITARALADRTVPAPLATPEPQAQAERPVRGAGAAARGQRVLSPRVQQLRQEGVVVVDSMVPRIELIAGDDTVRRPLNVNLAILHPAIPLAGVARPPANSASDWTLRGRVDVSGPFHYFWPAGTRFHITGERAGMYRVQLAGNLHAWVPTSDVRLLAAGAPPPGVEIGAVRFNAQPEYIDLRVPLGERLPFRVEEAESGLTLDVFGGISRVNFFQYGTLDPLIARAGWSQPADSVFRVQVELTQPVWGYDVLFDRSDALLLRIRRPPTIDPEQPLRGLRIAVDPGHPPAGAVGPTGLQEADANLAVGLKLRPLLERAGAHVIMTRTDNTPVELGARPRMAADSGAHILVSLHNNAFPDGVNPFANNGTSVYYFHPQSVDLAQRLQAELLDELGLRDIGIGRADLALVRPTWMPAALTETMYLMLPQQEAALRDPVTQERIARAHLRALEAFLRGRAAAQH